MPESNVETLENQPCPMCSQNTLTLMEEEREVPYFGNVFVFSMNCSNCKYHKADLEAVDRKDPVKFTLDITSEEDMKIRIIKSSEATIKIPHITTITPGPAAQGFITNVEGIFRRVKHQVEVARDSAEEKTDKKKAKNLLKKISKIMWGQEKTKITIEDPSGNSAIISDKAIKSPLKVKK